MLLGLAVPEVRLPAGRPPAGERLAAGLATGGAPTGAAAAGLGAGTSPVRRSGRAGADEPPPRGRLGAPVFPAEAGISLAVFGAEVDGPKVRARFSSERPGPEGRAGRAPAGLGAPRSRPFLSGRADEADGPPPLAAFGADVGGPKVRTRFSSERPGPEGRAGRAPAGLGAAVSLVRFAAGRPGPGLPEGLPRFCDDPAGPEGFDGLAPKWEGPGFPERLFVGMGSSSRAHIPCVVHHSVPVRPPPDKRNSPNQRPTSMARPRHRTRNSSALSHRFPPVGSQISAFPSFWPM